MILKCLIKSKAGDAGEVKGFPDERARKLIEKKICEIYRPPSFAEITDPKKVMELKELENEKLKSALIEDKKIKSSGKKDK